MAAKKKTRKVVFAVGTLILIAVFLHYGKSIYMPLVHKTKGKETVATVIADIQETAETRLRDPLRRAGYDADYPEELLLVAFKEERILQVYTKDHSEIKLVKEYPFTAYSGTLGPKLKQGDRQIPEGIYKVEYLNPNSSYHLSIKVSYPNEFDRSKTTLARVSDMGGDIFIHGKAVTIGCIPIGDKAIEEVFLLTQKAFNKDIRVIISPRDFRNNPAYPKIENIDWEDELYGILSEELKTLPIAG